MRIFLSAGEASGDACAAALVEELRRTGKPFIFEGVGGNLLQAKIGPLAANSAAWGAISIVQSLGVFFEARRGGMAARRQMAKGEPGLFIPIDFGFFNIRQAGWAKRHGWKVLYFMPPGSYKRENQGRHLSAVTDAVVTPFPWSAEILRERGVNARFFGHPIKQLIRERGPVMDRPREGIAILPGSRSTEVARHLPMVAALLKEWSIEDRRLEFAVAPNFSLPAFRASWDALAPGRDDSFTQADTYGVLARARAAIVCSGTATLEAALVRCPHVVTYRVTKAMAREAKLIRFKRPQYIALPNIVLDRPLVPELAGLEVAPAAIRTCLEPLLLDGPDRSGQLAGFEEIDHILGPDDAITKTAQFVIETTGR
ncbi:MAG TPA: hypothetical protein VMI31_06475 [Fimbriimonadaceae bacterium]|nr:hypothetical protein [Fimbriimonadaceae bacterium]